MTTWKCTSLLGPGPLFRGKLLEIQVYCMKGLSLLIIDPFWLADGFMLLLTPLGIPNKT